MTEIPLEKITVKVLGKDLILDPLNMKFDEMTLSEYMTNEFSYFDFYGKQLEYATKELALAELKYETAFNEKYIEAKDLGGSDNYAKAKAQCNLEVIEAHKEMIEQRTTVGFIKSYLKAWDKNHANAQSRANTLRKELEKLNNDIYKSNYNDAIG